MHDLQDRISRRTDLTGLVAKMPAPGIVEHAGYIGFDFVIIDTEHGPAETSVLENHVRAADCVGLSVLVRVPSQERAAIQWALDAGATGVIIPHVQTAEQARRVVSASTYPPAGTRGLALTTRAGRQGTRDLAQHLAEAARQTVVVVQIEDSIGVANCREIAEVAGVTAVWIGANDLAMEIGGPNRDDDAVRVSIDSVREAVDASPAALMMLCKDSHEAANWRSRAVSICLFTVHDVFRTGAQLLMRRDENSDA